MEITINAAPEEIDTLIKMIRRPLEAETVNEAMIRMRDAFIKRGKES